MQTPKKILVIRLSAIGDIVWTTPVVRMLKAYFPNTAVHFATKKQYKDMLSANPYIDKLHLFEGDIKILANELKKENFDLVIDLHKNLRSFYLRWALGAKVLSYEKQNWKRWLSVHFKIDLMKEHVSDRYQKALLPLGILPDGKGLDYFIAPENEIDICALPSIFSQNYVALVIGGSEYTKKLPFDRLIELCKKINKPIILVGGREDAEIGEAIEKMLPHQVWNSCGKFNLSQSASIVKQSELVFGHDTGLTQIAAAFKKKVFAIFGTTSPSGLYPYATPYKILENKNLDCRPCSRAGRKVCPKGHFKCMQELVFDFDESFATDK